MSETCHCTALLCDFCEDLPDKLSARETSAGSVSDEVESSSCSTPAAYDSDDEEGYFARRHSTLSAYALEKLAATSRGPVSTLSASAYGSPISNALRCGLPCEGNSSGGQEDPRCRLAEDDDPGSPMSQQFQHVLLFSLASQTASMVPVCWPAVGHFAAPGDVLTRFPVFVPGPERAGAATEPATLAPESAPGAAGEQAMSAGSVGHPHACGAPCKYAGRRGCKEGSQCSRCHICWWTREAEREATRKARKQL